MTELPKGWERAPIGLLCDLKNGMAFKPTDWSRTGMKIVRIQNLNNPEASYNFFEGEIRDRFIINRGDLLFAWSGTPGTSFGAHIWRGERAVLNQHIFRVDFDEACLNKSFFKLAINQKLGELIGKAHGGAGLQHVTKGRFEETLVEVPPLPEQHRIVAKIEALFSELDAGQDNLTRAQAQLKLYRQSLLKAAFQGRLTADWRAANPDKLESPETLLSRIRSERDARYKQALDDWQQALSEWRAGGEVGRKPAKPSRPAEVDALDASALGELPALPLGWTYIQLAHLGDLARGKSRHRPRNDPRLFGGPYPFIQTGEVKAAGREITSFSETYSEFGLLQSRLWPTGTLCITIAANIAETAFLGFDGCFPDSVVGFTAFETVVEPIFVELFIKAARVEISAYAPATAQKNINLTTLEELVVPYCGPDEQCELTRRIDALFSSVDAIELEITTALAKITALRQSILKQAFSGRLVPQDPADEPASVLLARLRATAPPARAKRKTPA
jgi:type I restriction enzyme S subunit